MTEYDENFTPGVKSPAYFGYDVGRDVIKPPQTGQPLKNLGHCISFFQSNSIEHGGNEVLSWFGTKFMVSFQEIAQTMFCTLAKISDLADLKMYYFNFEFAIELY